MAPKPCCPNINTSGGPHFCGSVGQVGPGPPASGSGCPSSILGSPSCKPSPGVAFPA